MRGGLLGQGSVLTITSYATRTSPVLRGKWVLENLLSSAPPPPPPDIPSLEDRRRGAGQAADDARGDDAASRQPGVRRLPRADGPDRLRDGELRRGRPLARPRRRATPIDATGVFPDGTKFDGIAGLKQELLRHPEQFVGTVAEKLLMYAVGRNLQYYDAPVGPRHPPRRGARATTRSSSLVLGVVKSRPFQMREAASSGAGSDVHHEEVRCRGGRSCGRWARPSRCRCSTRWCRRSRRGPLEADAAPRIRLHRQRRHPEPVESGDDRRRLRADADPAAVRQRARPDQRPQRPVAPAGRHLRRRHRRSSARVRGVADRRARLRPHAAGRRGEAGDDGRPDGRRSAIGRTSRIPSLELSVDFPTQGACDSGDCFYVNTVSWRNATTPNPTESHPRIVFERLFGDGGSAAARQARARSRGQHSRFGARRGQPRRQQPRPRRQGRSWASISIRCARSSSASRTPRRSRSTSSCPSGRPTFPTRFDAHTQADVRPAGAGVPGRHHARVQHDHVARAELAHVRAHRRARAASRRLASPQRSGADRQEGEDRRLPGAAVRLLPREAAGDAGRRRHRCSITR